MSNLLRYGFRLFGGKPQCVLCSIVLSESSKSPSKLKRHLESRHPEHVNEDIAFFEERLHQLNLEIVQTASSSYTENETLLAASFHSSLIIARNLKPHTLLEETVMPIMKIVVSKIIGEDAAKEIEKMPHSNNTVHRRIQEMGEDIQQQLKLLIKNSPFFTLQFDESVDVSGAAQLLCFVRYVGTNNIEEKLLFCLALKGHTTGECLFNAVVEKTVCFQLDWAKCVAICTDGGAAMTGRHKGFIKRIVGIAPHVKWSHCMIHRFSLAVKPLSCELKSVMEDCVKIVNLIKASSLKSRLFQQLCNDMESDFVRLLYHTQVRWLSRGKVLTRLLQLKDEVYIFLSNDSSSLAFNFDDHVWVCQMSYLADIFSLVNDLNLRMQGRDNNIINLQYLVEAFLLKIDFWEKQIKLNNFDSFPFLKAHSATYPPNSSCIHLFCTHLNEMKVLVRDYFPPTQKFVNDWVLNPFDTILVSNAIIENYLKEQLFDLSTHTVLETKFLSCNPSEFWIFLKDKYPALALRALKILVPFPTSYLCELGFSTLTYLKNKYRNRLQDIESDLLLSVNSSLEPHIDKLIFAKQAHPAH